MTQTNTHTYFFREPEALFAIRDEVIRPRAARGERTAIWCAGCSTGDEAYSVAMVGLEAGGRVEVLGTDLRADTLEHARAASYSERSLRHLDPARRERWLVQAGGNLEVCDELRRCVRFEAHDLQKDAPPRPRDGGEWDVILCRNVFLYFDRDGVARILTAQASVLAPSGVLVVGASEWLCTSVLSRLPAAASLACVLLGGSTAYSHASLAASLSVAPSMSEQRSQVGPSSPPSAGREGSSVAGRAPRPAVPMTDALHTLRRDGDEALDRGDGTLALSAYEQALAQDDLQADLYLRVAHCHLRLGRGRDAKEALRRGLFLDPSLWPAALMLGDLLVDEDRDAAKRYFAQAREILARPREGEAPSAMQPFVNAEGAALAAIKLRLRQLEGDSGTATG